jgi:uncharacterized protein YndB with AHSA1/START domain
MNTPTKITVEAIVQAPEEKAWICYTQPEHIVKWNFASDDWTCPAALNDLKPDGKMDWRMEAKDGSIGFNFTGTYIKVLINKEIVCNLDDNRTVEILFLPQDNSTLVRIIFEAEQINGIELQRDGWQAILNNYKKYTESIK